jgi:hypothetical protein
MIGLSEILEDGEGLGHIEVVARGGEESLFECGAADERIKKRRLESGAG